MGHKKAVSKWRYSNRVTLLYQRFCNHFVKKNESVNKLSLLNLLFFCIICPQTLSVSNLHVRY
jgi:hypothetical protein